MRVSNIRVEKNQTHATLTADLATKNYQAPGAFWIRVERRFASWLNASGDVFLAAFLIECMLQNENLHIDAPISQQLLDNVDELMGYHNLVDPQLHKIAISAPKKAVSHRQKPVASFFSGGVDSFYTYLHNQKKFRGRPNQQITHFLTIRGFDISLDQSQDQLWNETRHELSQAAKRFSVEPIFVETNIRTFADEPASWKRRPFKNTWAFSLHGSLLAAVGLGLSRGFSQIYIPASHSYILLAPWGSHPVTDPLWSTETVSFVHDGANMTRPMKVREIAHSKTFLRHLRVCWENLDGKYNCGRCEKCIRTMVILDLLDVLDQASTFPSRINKPLRKLVSLPTANDKKNWEELYLMAINLGKKKYAKRIRALIDG